jgi:hypothetical protein
MVDQISENVTKRVKLDESNDKVTQSRVWIAVPEHAHEYFSREVPNEFESLAFREKLLVTSLRNGFSEDNPAATPTPLKERKAVFILGPSAAGKTRALRTFASQLLGETTTNQEDDNSESTTTMEKPALGAYVLDGANFRSVSKTWATLLKSATEHSFTQKEMEAMHVESTQLDNKEQEFYLAGYSDGYKKFFKKPTDKLKKELTEHFIEEGASRSDLTTLSMPAIHLRFQHSYSRHVLKCRNNCKASIGTTRKWLQFAGCSQCLQLCSATRALLLVPATISFTMYRFCLYMLQEAFVRGGGFSERSVKARNMTARTGRSPQRLWHTSW